MKVHYTPESIDDLKRLREFIAQNNPQVARRIAADLLEGVERLKEFPQIGLPVSRAPDPRIIRDLFIGNYTVRYLLGDKRITVLRIWHHKENEKVNREKKREIERNRDSQPLIIFER